MGLDDLLLVLLQLLVGRVPLVDSAFQLLDVGLLGGQRHLQLTFVGAERRDLVLHSFVVSLGEPQTADNSDQDYARDTELPAQGDHRR